MIANKEEALLGFTLRLSASLLACSRPGIATGTAVHESRSYFIFYRILVSSTSRILQFAFILVQVRVGLLLHLLPLRVENLLQFAVPERTSRVETRPATPVAVPETLRHRHLVLHTCARVRAPPLMKTAALRLARLIAGRSMPQAQGGGAPFEARVVHEGLRRHGGGRLAELSAILKKEGRVREERERREKEERGELEDKEQYFLRRLVVMSATI